MRKELKEIFETYEFEKRIVYFSNYLTMHGRMTGELEQLRQILQLCKRIREIKMLYLTKSQESIYNITSGKNTSGIRSRKCSYGIWKYVSDKHQDSENSSFIFSGIHTGFFLSCLQRQNKAEKLFLRNRRNKIFISCVWMIWQNCFIKYDNWGKKNTV